MNTFEKAKFIRNFLDDIDDYNKRMYHKGWIEILDLYNSNNLSYEFRTEMEKEIDSIYNLVIESESSKKKETRIPALHTKATIHRFFNNDPIESSYPRHFLRVNDDSEEGFTDYAITHYDLDIMILDDSAEFVKNEHGNFLDYTEEAMKDSQYVL